MALRDKNINVPVIAKNPNDFNLFFFHKKIKCIFLGVRNINTGERLFKI